MVYEFVILVPILLILLGIISKMIFLNNDMEHFYERSPEKEWYVAPYEPPVDNIFIELLPNYTFFYEDFYKVQTAKEKKSIKKKSTEKN